MSLRIGVIGTGAIGQDHTRRINQVLSGAQVVAVNDVNRDNAARCVADHAPAARIFDDAHALIADPGIDAVLVCSWGQTHEEYVLASIAAGKPCFCEKPLATTAAGARSVVDAEVAQGKRLVQVGFMRRYDPGYVALKKAVETLTGAPLMVHAAHRNPRVGANYVTPMAIHDTLIHEIDVLRWLHDDDYVSAQVFFPRSTPRAHERLRDPQVVMLETAKGVVVDVEIFVNCHYGYDIQCEIVGEDGIARLPEPLGIQTRRNATLGTPILMDWKDRFIDSYDVELADFIRAAARGTAAGPSSGCGYVAALTAGAWGAAPGAAGEGGGLRLPARPGPYD